MAEIRNSSYEHDTEKGCIKIFNYARKTNDDFSHRTPLQHGSPELRRNYIYPTQSTPVQAFQAPLYHSPKSFPLHQELRSLLKGSPASVKSARIIHDSPFLTVNTDESVNKIRAMFPTVSDTHIRLLLKKYHGREAVVISALQVEKYPISTPGPFPTPPLSHARASMQTNSPFNYRGTSSTETDSPKPGFGYSNGSPACYRNSPRPHSSPKLKLRYMKSLFPQPDETVILDVLTSNDNDIQKTTDALKEMGFQRKDTTKVEKRKMPATPQKVEEKEEKSEIAPVAKIKSLQEKEKLTVELKKKYPDTPQHLVSIALESVNFDEKRADQILQIISQEEQEKAEKHPPAQPLPPKVEHAITPPAVVPVSQSRQSLKSILKSEKAEVHSFSRCVDKGEEHLEFRSPLLSNTKGANSELSKGPNHSFLLSEYIKCQGPTKGLQKGPQGLSKGPNAENLLEQKSKACGPNLKLRKGSNLGLAKGSIFAQFKRFVTGESRVK